MKLRAATALLALTAAAASAAGIPTAQASPPTSRASARIALVGHPAAHSAAAFAVKVTHAKVSRATVSFGDRTRTVTSRHAPARITHTFAQAGWYTVTLTLQQEHARTLTSKTRVLIVSPTPAATTTVIAPADEPVAAHPDTSTVTTVSPSSGPVTKVVTITGTGFTSPATVTFNGTSATATVTSATTIATSVPVGASTGPLVVTSNGSTVSAGTFTVTLGVALSVSSGPPTTTTAIVGSGFGPNEAVDLYSGTSAQALVTSAANGTFTYSGFTIPVSAQPGALQISAIGRHTDLATQTPFTVQTDSTGLGFGSAHHGTNPYENTLSPGNVASVGKLWSTTVADGITSTAAVVKGVAYYTTTDGNLVAANATTGATLWTVTVGGSASSPAVAAGIVYDQGSNGLFAVNASTGTVKWSQSAAAAYYSSPNVVGSSVYVATASNKVYDYNAATGAVTWVFTLGNSTFSSPTVSGGLVYIGDQDAKVYALNASTGALTWAYVTGGPVEGSPAVVDGSVYVGAADDKLYALSAINGSVQWTYTTSNSLYGSPAVSGDTVYFGSSDDHVYAVDATTGALQWSTPTNGADSAGVTVANGVVYSGTYVGRLYFLAATNGAILGSVSAGSSYYFDIPTVVNGTIYAGNQDGTMTAYSLPAGANPAS